MTLEYKVISSGDMGVLVASVIRRGFDGHKYKLPIEKAEAFMWALDEICKHEECSDGFFDAVDSFDAAFCEYMTGESE